jgi:hypothetical protein
MHHAQEVVHSTGCALNAKQLVRIDFEKARNHTSTVHLNDLICSVGYKGKPGFVSVVAVRAGDLSYSLSSLWWGEGSDRVVPPEWVVTAAAASHTSNDLVHICSYGYGIFGPMIE